MPRTKLPVKLEKFALCYAVTGDRNRGYAATGSRGNPQTRTKTVDSWLAKPEVQARIEEIRSNVEEQIKAEAVISAAWVDERLVKMVEKCVEKEDAQGAFRGLELCGKRQGLFTDKTMLGDIDATLEGKTPEQIEAMKKALIAEIGPVTIRRYLAEIEGTSGRQADGPGTSDASAEEADGLPAVPEAGGVSSGRVLQ